jgi:hypothetical protein
VLISDFRDVFFQANPFHSRFVGNLLLKPSVPSSSSSTSVANTLMVFQEAHPNKVINRDPQLMGWLIRCYGEEILKYIGCNVGSCGGIVLGNRASVMVYSLLLLTQIDSFFRGFPYNSTRSSGEDKKCLTFGVDQGFHNVLLYSHMFS